MSLQTPVYVINMVRDHDRMAAMALQFEKLGMAFERVEAVAGAALSSADRRRIYSPLWFWIFHGRFATAGELGCALSHRKVWIMMKERQQGFALIFEDDAFVSQALARDCLEIEALTRDFDMVQLYAFRSPTQVIRRSSSGAFSVKTFKGPHGSTAAYGLRLSGALKLLRPARVRMAVDKWTWASALTGLRSCAVSPFPVGLHETMSANSTIAASSQRRRGNIAWRVLVLPLLRVARFGIMRLRGV